MKHYRDQNIISAIAIAIVMTASAEAEWRPADEAVAEAARHPRVAAVLDAVNRIDAAILAGDRDGFLDFFSGATVVNSPFNTVADRDEAGRRFASGMLAYRCLVRTIEYAAPRGDSEVVLMGEEVYEPRAGHPLAGRTVRRRFTDLWVLQDGQWQIALRQATVVSDDQGPGCSLLAEP